MFSNFPPGIREPEELLKSSGTETATVCLKSSNPETWLREDGRLQSREFSDPSVFGVYAGVCVVYVYNSV